MCVIDLNTSVTSIGVVDFPTNKASLRKAKYSILRIYNAFERSYFSFFVYLREISALSINGKYKCHYMTYTLT